MERDNGTENISQDPETSRRISGEKNTKNTTMESIRLDDEGVLTFSDELIDAMGWNIGDTLEWVDNNDGSFTLKKVTDGNS
tara:strand:- start:128 stop:370 length:243 start_codon:yes stop_codon:yes gene_type:complete